MQVKTRRPTCEVCEANGARYTVTTGGTVSTAMATHHWWDEDGKEHFHDPNDRVSNFRCSNGHTWGETRKPRCPGCGKEGR